MRELYKEQAREHKEQAREICLAILERRIDAVQSILGNGFVPDSETLNVAAVGDSTEIFSLIADAGSFSDGDFKMADDANVDAHKKPALHMDMWRVIRHHRHQLERSSLLKTYRSPTTASNAT